jgi:hypothetical protein
MCKSLSKAWPDNRFGLSAHFVSNNKLGRMKRRVLGTVACVVGLAGVLTAVLAHHVVARAPEPPPSWEVNVNIGDALKWRYGNAPPAAPAQRSLISRDSMALVAIGVGCVAIAFAVASWIRREGVALGVLALFLGAAAIAWEQVVVLFGLFILVGGPAVWFYWPWAERRKLSRAT